MFNGDPGFWALNSSDRKAVPGNRMFDREYCPMTSAWLRLRCALQHACGCKLWGKDLHEFELIHVRHRHTQLSTYLYPYTVSTAVPHPRLVCNLAN